MTTPTTPLWTRRLQESGNRILAGGIALALITIGAWLYAAKDDGQYRLQRVAPGPAMISDAKVELVRIFLPTTVDRSTLDPPAGTTDVAAEVAYDFTQSPDADSCSAILTAGEYTFASASWATIDGNWQTCEPGMNNTITYIFEVPDHLVEQVDGVGILILAYNFDFVSVANFETPHFPTYHTVLPGRIS